VKTKRLALAIDRIGPLSIPQPNFKKAEDFLARSIVGQQLSVAAARTIWGRLEDLAKSKNKTVTELSFEKDKENIRESGVSYAKIKALECMTTHFKKEGFENILQRLSHNARSKELTQIWGIGQWSCDMLSIFHYGEENIWPLNDAGLKRACSKLLDSNKISIEEFSKFGEQAKPYRSYLSLYLWHIIDNDVI
jgi:DNA-3-methyladenine glycosylase II